MSAATELYETIEIGDSVFVHPDEGAPDSLRGIRGIVAALHGDEAELRQHASDEVIQVEVAVLRRDRRRTHIRADWEHAS